MAKPTKTIRKKRDPELSVKTSPVEAGTLVYLQGIAWPLDAIDIRIGNVRKIDYRILQGSTWNGKIVPDAQGDFLLEIPTDAIKPGKYDVTAKNVEGNVTQETSFTVRPRTEWGPKVPREK